MAGTQNGEQKDKLELESAYERNERVSMVGIRMGWMIVRARKKMHTRGCSARSRGAYLRMKGMAGWKEREEEAAVEKGNTAEHTEMPHS